MVTPLLDHGDVLQLERALIDGILALAWPKQGEALPWLVGIHRGGAQLARELADAIALSEGWRPPVGTIDITLHRDDTFLQRPQLTGARTDLPGDPTGQRIVLIDDVLHTGRTVRAALEELLDFGRPEAVRLAVLVDRGGRELPVAANVVGQTIDVAADATLELVYGPEGRIHGAQVRPKRAP
jgi:pyrimidine operon attenuation protein/uracil phosphoribosyltransferase